MSVYWNHTVFLLLALFSPLLSPTLGRANVLDADINFHVTNALLSDSRVSDSRVSAAEISATTTEGVVTLSGSVDNLAAKTFAVAEAKKINGVLSVIDKITVTPEFRWDNDIANSVRRRLLNSSVIKSQGLVVTCQDGVVTLEGSVDSYSQQQQAGLLASEVDGVKQVNNNILTTWSTTRSDSEIKNDAVAALARDVYPNGLPIAVSVQDGHVSLSGSVGNANEKDRAYEDVRWIANVTSVDNGLSVEWYEPQDVKTDNQTPSDDAIEHAVRATLDQDSRLFANNITLRVSSGTVTLDGSVSSVYERRIAEQDARNVIGVAWVQNNLFASAERRSDWVIQGDVQYNLDTDAVTGGFELDANVQKGIVTLTGKVHSWYERARAYDVASRVRGVKAVFNDIAVAGAIANNGTNWKSDAELVKTIKGRLRGDWTTWWVLDKINVTVNNGVATLEGDLNTWKERQESGFLALHTSGISEVDNRLTVKGVAYPWDEHHYKLTGF